MSFFLWSLKTCEIYRTVPLRYDDITIEDWKSALKLSVMWNFESVGIRELNASNKLDAVSKILLSIKYDKATWLISGCNHFIDRDSGPRKEEAELLGTDITTRIWDLREQKILSTIKKSQGPRDMKANIEAAFTGYAVNFNPEPEGVPGSNLP